MGGKAKEDPHEKAARAVSPGRLFGSKNEKKKDEKEPQAVEGDATADGEKISRGKSWMGKEKKKPRADYQAEIDELKVKLAGLSGVEEDRNNQAAQVTQLTQQLSAFKMWMRQAPRVV